MLRYRLLLVSLLLAACGGTEMQNKTVRKSGVTSSYSEENTAGDFYRRYAGTIAEQPVVLQLHRFAGSYTGSYQYSSQGRLIRLLQDAGPEGSISFTEYPPEAPGAENAHLTLTLAGPALSGEWVSADGSQRFPVQLQEAYPAGSFRLQAAHLEDTASLVAGHPMPFATASYHYLLPAAGESAFLGSSLIGLLTSGQTPAGDVHEVLRAEADAYFDRYRQEVGPMVQGGIDSAAMFAFSYSTDKSIEVLYNDNGWVVLRERTGENTGGVHGNYTASFRNLDVAGSRTWTLADMVPDTNALKPLLNDAAIRYFNLKPGAGMSHRLLVSEVPVTSNIFLTATGIAFVYNPYDIAAHADGEVQLFLPFSRLSALLSQPFRSRMKLGSRAGVAQLSSEPNSRLHGRNRT